MKLGVKSVSIDGSGSSMETTVSGHGDDGEVSIEIERPALVYVSLEGTGTSKERGVIKVSPTGMVTLSHWSGVDGENWTGKELTARQWVALVTGAKR